MGFRSSFEKVRPSRSTSTGSDHCSTADVAAASREGAVPDSQAELMRALHDEHAAALWAYALRLTGGDRARAEDVVQETLLRAWRNPAVLDRGDGARSWLFTVARRIVIDEWRTKRSRSEVSVAELPGTGRYTSANDETEQTMLVCCVAEALERLSVPHRQVIIECHYLGHSVAEAAGRLGVPEGTVKSRLHYALRALRLSLEELGVSE
ncbi:MAG: sigma-70 family RNA polymerase sigma factor [Streptosporangiales bacterium]|nr:sigma-70 family RNA polymerase sigma factor [Streptosporangiales bacterium]